MLPLQSERRNTLVCRQSALLLMQGRAVVMGVKDGISGKSKIWACQVILPQASDTLGHGNKPPCSFPACLASALGTVSLLALVPLVLLGWHLGCPSELPCTGTQCWNTLGLATPCGHYCPQMDQSFKKSQGGWWFLVKACTAPSVACLL